MRCWWAFAHPSEPLSFAEEDYNNSYIVFYLYYSLYIFLLLIKSFCARIVSASQSHTQQEEEEMQRGSRCITNTYLANKYIDRVLFIWI